MIFTEIPAIGFQDHILFDSLRFGMPSDHYNRYLLKGVVDGIQFYGNCIGIPTVGGEVFFDDRYSGNCLVNVMCIGHSTSPSIALVSMV